MQLLAKSCALALVFGVGAAGPAAAAILTITGQFDGTIDGEAFSNYAITFHGVADNGTPSGPAVTYAISSLTADLGSLTLTFSDPFHFDDVFGGVFHDLYGAHHLLTETGGTLIAGSDLPSSTDLGPFTLTGGQNIAFSFSSAPEPASWAMMLGGFGLAGAALRRRQKVAIRFG